jgi:predicted membrane-bound mannosyltransferase
VWSEGIILGLASLGFLAAMLPARLTLVPHGRLFFVRWTALYSLLLTAAYTAIPYKTTWCLMEFLLGMILLAGVGVVVVVGLVPTRPLKGLIILVLASAVLQLAGQAYRASYVLAGDTKNPYVYAHTSADIKRLASDVEQMSTASPKGKEMLIQVIWHDAYYWPLPWYLRSFKNVGYWNQIPEQPGAPVVIASPAFDKGLTKKLDVTHLMTGFYEVRHQVLGQMWVRMDVWEAHLRRLGRI